MLVHTISRKTVNNNTIHSAKVTFEVLIIYYSSHRLLYLLCYQKRNDEGILLESSGRFFSGYDPNVRATTLNAFAAAALRMGHSLIRQTFGQFSKAFVRLGEINTTTFFNPDLLYTLRNNGIDGISLGLIKEPSQKFDR